jgi:hypothetical protein
MHRLCVSPGADWRSAQPWCSGRKCQTMAAVHMRRHSAKSAQRCGAPDTILADCSCH